ncbi:MAG: peptidase M14 [Phycisphaerales bacterium]|nr:peptidase M14 [Phycisphaerales bacterium]
MNTRKIALAAVLLGGLVGNVMAKVVTDADYPGGNIIVERINGDVVDLRQDLRNTKGWWFYWSFQVHGASERKLTFHFTNKNVIGTRGPAISIDGGKTWSWLGTGNVKGTSFVYSFQADTKNAKPVRFAFAIPYQEANLKEFLGKHAKSKHLSVQKLCKTRKGRIVERIHVGRLDGKAPHRILLTCRHHSCESMASYVLEGAMEAVLADTESGKWLRQNVEVLAIPFVDKDGVEDGDQGKNRKPRDHNRDYVGKSVHASTAAIRKFVPKWSNGRLKIAIDLHCPWIRGKHNEVIYMVGSNNKAIWEAQCKFAKTLETICGSGLPYKASDNLPFGKSWNTGGNYKAGKSSSRWAAELKGVSLATTIEVPYANADKVTITPKLARAFGAALSEAIYKHLQSPRKNSNAAGD